MTTEHNPDNPRPHPDPACCGTYRPWSAMVHRMRRRALAWYRRPVIDLSSPAQMRVAFELRPDDPDVLW